MVRFMTDEVSEFTFCMLGNARRAARTITRRYDNGARAFGLRAAQFYILFLIREHEGLITGELAEHASMDRTTLVRNIELLKRKGLIESTKAEQGKGRTYTLSKRAHRLVEEAIPAWRAMQAELKDELGEAEFYRTIDVLKRLAAI